MATEIMTSAEFNKTVKNAARFAVGVDCGLNTGIAVYDCAASILHSVHTTDFFGAEEFLSKFLKDELSIFVEIPPQFIYARNAFQTGAVRDKHAISIGGNRREALLLAESLRRSGYHVREVPPIRAAKWTQAEFERQLKTTMKTNQHVRDSARLAYIYAGKVV